MHMPYVGSDEPLVLADSSFQQSPSAEWSSVCPFELLFFDSLEEASRLNLSRAPQLVIVENSLHGSSCVEVVARLRRERPATCVLVATAFPCFELAWETTRAGAADYITRPLSFGDLTQLLPETASSPSSGTWLDPLSARRAYIDIMLNQCQSIAGTARILGLDRRSLRRMLSRCSAGASGLRVQSRSPSRSS